MAAEPIPVTPPAPDRWQQFDELLNDKAWQHLGITGQEFVRRWYAGQYKQDDRDQVRALNELMQTGEWG